MALPEIYLPALQEPENEEFRANALLVVSALREGILHDYGNPDNPSTHTYHNLYHTDEVTQDVAMLALMAHDEGILDELQLYELVMAGAGHDRLYVIGAPAGVNETRSAHFVSSLITDTGYFAESTAQAVSSLVLATAVDITNPTRIIQSVVLGTPSEHLLQDADLGNFGKEFSEYFMSALSYFYEIHRNITDPEARKEALLRFLQNNVAILGNHEYKTDQARILFPNKDRNVELLQKRLANPSFHLLAYANPELRR